MARSDHKKKETPNALRLWALPAPFGMVGLATFLTCIYAGTFYLYPGKFDAIPSPVHSVHFAKYISWQ
jgi:hypothetical protein